MISKLAIILFLLQSISDINGLTYTGCFKQRVGASVIDLAGLAFADKTLLQVNEQSIQKCIDHCTAQSQKYAAIQTKTNEMSCYCGSERAYKRLGVPYDTNPNTPCHDKTWSLRTYIATGDVSRQFIGCFTEVSDNDKANMASLSHLWIDPWGMTPKECIDYCKFNGEPYANLRGGDTCTCGRSYAKHGISSNAACNIPCVDSQGEKCGGSLANSVYSTLALEDAMKPADKTPIYVNSKEYKPVDVPNTQLLIQSIVNIQQSVQVQQPRRDARNLISHLLTGHRLAQHVLDVRVPVLRLTTSQGFTMSSSAQVANWISGNYPPELQEFVTLIRRSQSFLHNDVQRVIALLSAFAGSAVPLQTSITQSISSLNNYFNNGVLEKGLHQTFELAKLMVSSSRKCILLLDKTKSTMVGNLEDAAKAMLDGPHGLKLYREGLRKPFSDSAAAKATVPKIDRKWTDSLKEIESSWTAFMATYGRKLNTLMLTQYPESCTQTNNVIGRRAVCQNGRLVSISTMLSKAGDNQAKQDVENFVENNKEAFKAFDWSYFEKKLDSLYKVIESIKLYLVQAGMSSPLTVSQLQKPITGFQFYQTCVNNLSHMIRDVCHRSLTPDSSKVHPLHC